jgi:hypothetical protein
MPIPEIKSSEFEGEGPRRSGVFAHLLSAAEKLRIIRRTEQDPDREPVDLDAEPDKWRHGGVKPGDSGRWWEIRP